MRKDTFRRYWPFLAVAALQLFLVTTDGDDVGAVANSALTTGQPGLQLGVPGQTQTGPVSVDNSSGAATGPVSTDGQTAAGAATVSATGSGGPSAVAATGASGGTSSGAQPLDALGRPLDGDRSRCAEGGLLQEDISFHSPPCIPELEGSNGGATWQGVTEDEIVLVVIYPNYDAGVQQVLVANGLAMTPAQSAEAHQVMVDFMEKHYNLYGRKVRIEQFHSNAGSDPIALRADAKQVVQKYKPFAVTYYLQGSMPEPTADQLVREGVIAIGAGFRTDEWYQARAPYAVDGYMSGSRFTRATADYYCKRMYGKNASLAGDPTLRIKTRKLGIVTTETPDNVARAQLFKDLVTGGMCGSPNDGTTVYTLNAEDPASDAPALIRRMRSDGMTTLHNGWPYGAEMDNQGYFPEHLISEFADDDTVGRVFVALSSPNQMQNTTGIGLYPKQAPVDEREWTIVAKTTRPGYEPPFLAEATFAGVHLFARSVQFAGPNLNPATFLQGMRSVPQINGWENPNPWPGWTCCDPYRIEIHGGLEGDNSFSLKADVRQIFWDSRVRSEQDGAIGSWVGVDDSRRYEVGKFPPGEPRQP